MNKNVKLKRILLSKSGFEPLTHGFSIQYSNQLSYLNMKKEGFEPTKEIF